MKRMEILVLGVTGIFIGSGIALGVAINSWWK